MLKQLYCIEPEIEKILRKNQKWFLREIDPHHKSWLPSNFRFLFWKTFGWHYDLLTSPWHLIPYTEGRWSKYLWPLVSPRKTATAIMMLYKTQKEKLFHRIKTQTTLTLSHLCRKGNTLAPILFIIFTNPSARAGYDTRSIFEVQFNRFEFSFPSPRLVVLPRLKNPVCPTIYP